VGERALEAPDRARQALTVTRQGPKTAPASPGEPRNRLRAPAHARTMTAGASRCQRPPRSSRSPSSRAARRRDRRHHLRIARSVRRRLQLPTTTASSTTAALTTPRTTTPTRTGTAARIRTTTATARPRTPTAAPHRRPLPVHGVHTVRPDLSPGPRQELDQAAPRGCDRRRYPRAASTASTTASTARSFGSPRVTRAWNTQATLRAALVAKSSGTM